MTECPRWTKRFVKNCPKFPKPITPIVNAFRCSSVVLSLLSSSNGWAASKAWILKLCCRFVFFPVRWKVIGVTRAVSMSAWRSVRRRLSANLHEIECGRRVRTSSSRYLRTRSMRKHGLHFSRRCFSAIHPQKCCRINLPSQNKQYLSKQTLYLHPIL